MQGGTSPRKCLVGRRKPRNARSSAWQKRNNGPVLRTRHWPDRVRWQGGYPPNHGTILTRMARTRLQYENVIFASANSN
jgi:hypothetical protein